jgi:hypothetical protein
MDAVRNSYELPLAVRRAIAAVRRRLRAYVWAEGLAALTVLLGSAFWLGLLLDWWFEPSPTARSAAVGAVIIAGVFVVYRFLLRRAFVPISDGAAAILLERRYPVLGDHVTTAVHVASSPGRAAAYHPELIARTQTAAANVIREIRPAGLFRSGPLTAILVAAALLSVSIGLFAILASDTFGFWLDRLAMSDRPWPRRVHLEVVGFDPDDQGQRVHKLAKEDGFELLVRAALGGYEAPDLVEVRTRAEDGRRARDTLTRVGESAPGRDEFQLYRYVFKRVSESMTLDVVGGDDRVRNLRLEVVERPELFSLEFECEYPEYLGREPRLLAVTGGMRIPEGTRLVLHAASSKPLVASRIRTSSTDQDVALEFHDEPSESLRWEYGPLQQDDVLLINATDVDGVTCREPYRVSLAVVPDEPPQVAVRLAGIGTAITPEARIPAIGKITDDYGLKEAWFEYQVDDHSPSSLDLAINPSAEAAVNPEDAFDTRAINPATDQRLLLLRPGQRLSLWIKATDRYDLSDQPRAGSSQQFMLDVVTVSDLLALLERRELELRQRFEAIVEKMTDTRNLLARVEFESAPDGQAEAADGAMNESPDAERTEEDSSGQEGPDEAAARALARRRLRVAGSLQNINQSADEVLGVAEAFDDIHDQLTNNRIDNPELMSRLRGEIAVPLHQIGEIRMPELAAQVKLVETHVEDPAAGPPALADALKLSDEILIEMRHVLERMLELETFNEVVSQLRDIITDQEEIKRRTQEQQRQRLRQLFEEDK